MHDMCITPFFDVVPPPGLSKKRAIASRLGTVYGVSVFEPFLWRVTDFLIVGPP